MVINYLSPAGTTMFVTLPNRPRTYHYLASAVGRLPSPRSGVNGQARRLAGTVAVQSS